jgi:hypothetical protein
MYVIITFTVLHKILLYFLTPLQNVYLSRTLNCHELKINTQVKNLMYESISCLLEKEKKNGEGIDIVE